MTSRLPPMPIPEVLFEGWRNVGQMGVLTDWYLGGLGLPAEFIVGDLRAMLETQVGISQKDLSLALALGDSRPGTAEFLAALHDAMPAVYHVHPELGS